MRHPGGSREELEQHPPEVLAVGGLCWRGRERTGSGLVSLDKLHIAANVSRIVDKACLFSVGFLSQ